MTLSDEAKAARAALDAEYQARRRDFIDGTRPLIDSRFGARTIGDLALVEVGASVWTDPEKKRYAHEESMGGIVLQVTDRRRTDDETGEITVTRAFRCYDPTARWDKAFRTLSEDLIARDGGIEIPTPGQLVTAIRRFCRVVADGHGMLDTRQAQLVVDASRLVTTVLSGGV